jgi:hypothetical protein
MQVFFDAVSAFGPIALLRADCCVFVLQERLTSKDQKISENFFARGDGTV